MSGLWRKRFGKAKYLVIRRDGSVPEFEWFVLASSDPAAPAALRAYAEAAKLYDFDPDYVEDVGDLADHWETHGHQVGDPDKPPHRKDHPAVIAALGEVAAETPEPQPRRGAGEA